MRVPDAHRGPFRRSPVGRGVSGGVVVAILIVGRGLAGAADAKPPDPERLFENRVRPLLVAECQRCHGDSKAESGLRLDSRRALLAGGDSGPVIVPGDIAGSRLVAAVKRAGDLAMPPDKGLSPDDVAATQASMAAGAPWPGPGGDSDAARIPAATIKERLAGARASHWAFTPPTRHAPPELPAGFPAGLRGAWSISAIDRFVGAAAHDAGIEPSAEAAPRDLFRRLCHDLTGLPPTADEADAYCARAEAGPDAADSAFRDAVERLLASRAHAEHWARKWLDLARYADTMGYVLDNQDNRYPFAWTYRDWVVDSLHRDLPYDRFVTLQLAADRIDPPVPQADLAALGFLTVGRTFLGNTHDIIDDRIDLVTRGLLGLTVACGRCHDHKYEPISTADYYGLHGIFASCRIPQDLPVIGAAPVGPQSEAFAKKLATLEAAVAAHEAAVHARAVRDAFAHAADYVCEVARPAPRGADNRPPRLADGYELEQFFIDRLRSRLDGAKPTDPILGAWAAARGKSDAEIGAAIDGIVAGWGAGPDPQAVNPLVVEEIRTARPRTLRALAEVYARLLARVAPHAAGSPASATAEEPPALAALRAAFGVEGTPLVVSRSEAMRVATQGEQTEHRKRQREIVRHESEAPGGPPRAMVIVDADKPVDSHVLVRGNPGRPGEKVSRRLPMILGGGQVDRGSSGRLDLARAIVSPENPLAARMIVNWVWMHHVGHGLVDTPGDFGLRGSAPSHPQLLDDLARRFMEEGGWSLRWLHREIVTSRTWRQSSLARPEIVDRDPENRLFARGERRRLDWEAWRDSLLAAAGTLDPGQRGGPGVDPLAESAMHARSLYGRLDRQDVPGILRVFDIANPDTAVHVRPRTTVPQQGLAVLNAPIVVATARRVAARIDREVGASAEDRGRIVATWRAVLARSPDADEIAAAEAWLAEELRRDAAAQPAAMTRWERLAQALVGTAEFQFYD